MTASERIREARSLRETRDYRAGDSVLIHDAIPATFTSYRADGFCVVECICPWDGHSVRVLTTNPDWLRLA